MEKLQTLNNKLWKLTRVLYFLCYGVICFTEGVKVYTGYVQDEPIPIWSIYLFLSVAVLTPGLLSFATKNKGVIARFFIGSGRFLVSVALLIGCLLSQKGLEPEKVIAMAQPQIASQAMQNSQPAVDTTPPSVMECVMNGKKYHSNLPFDIIKNEIKSRCLKSVFAYGSDKP